MKPENDQTTPQTQVKAFNIEAFNLLQSTFSKHIKKREFVDSNQSDSHQIDPSDENNENVELNTISELISSALYEFLDNLQAKVNFDTFDVVQKSLDSIQNKLKAIEYSKWNRPISSRYRNVYNRLLQRTIKPQYTPNTHNISLDYVILSRKLTHLINIWSHQNSVDDSLEDDSTYIEPPQVTVVKFDKTGEVIITGGSEGIIKLWDVTTCKLIMSLKRHSGPINHIDIHPTNSFIISSNTTLSTEQYNSEIYLWEINVNFYRPHKVINNVNDIVFLKFATSTATWVPKNIEDISMKGVDFNDRKNWEASIENTIIISLDKNNVLKVYRMRDMITSSSGNNIYNEVAPKYIVDLFNHEVTGCDISINFSDSNCLAALGIKPMEYNNSSSRNVTFNSIVHCIKNDTFHDNNFNVKGKYRNLTDKNGVILLKIPITPSDNDNSVDDRCECDSNMKNTSTCVNMCTLCGRVKYNKSNIFENDVEENEMEPNRSGIINKFLWESDHSSSIEKYFNTVIPDFTFVNASLFESFTFNFPVMHYLKNSSNLIMPAFIGKTPAFVKESGDLDNLFVNFLGNECGISPQIRFSNTSMDYVTASKDNKFFLWQYENGKFVPKQLYSEDLNFDFENYVLTLGTNNATNTITDSVSRTSSVNRTVNDKSMYNIVSLEWSCNDKYVCIADELMNKEACVNGSSGTNSVFRVSFFTDYGKFIAEKRVKLHVVKVKYNPVSEDLCIILCQPSDVMVYNIATRTVINTISFENSASWLDIQWHPMGHKFVTCGKYGSLSLFSTDSQTLMDKTPNYQLTVSDYNSHIQSYINAPYRGFEPENLRLKRYFSSFSDSQITMEGDSTYEMITKALFGGPVAFLNEQLNTVLLHIGATISRYHNVSYGVTNDVDNNGLLYGVMMRLGGFDEYFRSHNTETDVNLLRIVDQFLHLLQNSNDKNGENNNDGVECSIEDCIVCKNYANKVEQHSNYILSKDSYVTLRSVTDKNGIVILSLPPSQRPSEFVEAIQIVQSEDLHTPRRFSNTVATTQPPSDLHSVVNSTSSDGVLTSAGRTVTIEPQVLEREEDEEESEDSDYEESPEESDSESHENDASVRRSVRASTRRSYEVEEDSEKYSLRAKRGFNEDSYKIKEIDSAKKLSNTIGAISILNQNKPGELEEEEIEERFCILCGMSSDGYYTNLTRSQTQKFSTTLFSQGHSFNPGCKFYENTIVGPMNIHRRYRSYLEDYHNLSKRINSNGNIFAHSACIITSQVKIDQSTKLINFPEILVTSSYEKCGFCDSNFATVPCVDCGRFFHYPCAVAQYKGHMRYDKDMEIVNYFDPLLCKRYFCIDCGVKSENGKQDYLTSICFLKPDTRDWLTNKSDVFENKFNVQVGDYIVLTPDCIFERYNTHVPWITQQWFPILVKVLDKSYVFTDDMSVTGCILVESVFGEPGQFCVFTSPEIMLTLLRDFLISPYNLSSVKVGSKVKCKINGQIIETEVKNVKQTLNGLNFNINGEIPDETLELTELKRVIEDVYKIGHNSVSISYDKKIKWVDCWNLDLNDEIKPKLEEVFGKIKSKGLNQEHKDKFLNLIQDPKYGIFEYVEEYGLRSHEWVYEYWRYIPRPISLNEIREKLRNDYYRTPKGVWAEIKLLISNCINFNETSSNYSKIAREVDVNLDNLMINMANDYNWTVIFEHIWPFIRNFVKPSVQPSSQPHRKNEINQVEQEFGEYNVSKRRKVNVQEPVRRSSRIVQKVEKQVEEVKVRKKTLYNLR
ncbi:uncharacterized protein TA16925 [Theileria annulata]|uniref:Bromo domain-containing protein n=1 Tax=Theileria annulata TaxID=5874 RepID=Q4UIM3_THEAN|nr:uncharacterized protein TA16925 [Theileria annulata]CAI73066.1 hypothetical protein, conserved [Theileria annulata]|eukprot:XP_953744.1 hypothetical protein, conserved [Theileria annulata]